MVVCSTNAISKKPIVSFPWIPKIIFYWGTPGRISFISTGFLPWAYVLRLWPVNAPPQRFLGFHNNRGAYCSIIWMILSVSPSNTATADFEALKDLLASLGLQESPETSCLPSPVMICLGVELDTNNFSLSVSSERLCELEHLLDQWLSKCTSTKSALQSLVGKLVFVSKCVRQSRVFISRILAVLHKMRFNHHDIHLTAEFRKDLVWWRRFLQDYNGVSMINIARWTSPGKCFPLMAVFHWLWRCMQ